MRFKGVPVVFFLLSLCGLTALPVNFSSAQESMRIAAIVNDDVITFLDVESRTQLAIVSANLTDTPEVRNKLRPQVVQVLIDEKLKLQEAKRLNVVVSDQEIDGRFEELAKANGITAKEFEKRLTEGGITRAALTDKIRSDIAWARVVRRRAGSIKIEEDQVTEAVREIEQSAGKPEYLISEIFLSSEGRTDTAQAAQQLLKQFRDGAEFSDLARQFSQGGNAANGGDLGWTPTTQIDQAILAVLETLDNGQVTEPIAVPGGIRILQLRGKRLAGAKTKTNIDLRQMLLPVGNKVLPNQEIAAQKVKELLSSVKTCGDFEAIYKRIKLPGSPIAKVKTLDELAPSLRQQIGALSVNQMTPVLKIPKGVAVFMLCKRQEVKVDEPLPTRKQIEDRLLEQRLELSSKSYLRDLRRSAYVDIRV